MRTPCYTADSAKISRVTIEIPGEEPLRIEREAAPAKDEGRQGGPRACSRQAPVRRFSARRQEAEGCSAAESIARALASIDMEDVRKLDAPPAGAGVSTVKIEVGGWPGDDAAPAQGWRCPLAVVTASGEGEAKKAAEEITQRTQGWEYKLPATKADSILKKRADLLDPAGS